MSLWDRITSSFSSSPNPDPPKRIPPEPPNLNSPPGAPIPNAPPSSKSNAPLTETATTASQMQPLQTSEQSLQPLSQKSMYYTAVGVAVACPLIMLMPPRKFDPFTFGLCVAFCMSTGFILEQKTGKGLVWHVGTMIPSVANAERRERERALEESRRKESGRPIDQARENEEKLKRAKQERGMLKRVWMGEEGDDWVEERKRKEREALEEGRGYGGLIFDYVKEAFGMKDDDEDDDNEAEDNGKA